MPKKKEKMNKCQRVSVPDAAKEIGCEPDFLRFLMRTKKIDIGVVIPPKEKRGRYQYLIFRAKLDRFLGIENGGISDAKS